MNLTGSLHDASHLFEVFSYEGSLRFNTRYERDAITGDVEVSTKTQDGSFFLIPLVISERLVVYFAQEDDRNTSGYSANLTEFCQNINGHNGKAAKPYIDMADSLVLNDHMGIFVCSEVNYFS